MKLPTLLGLLLLLVALGLGVALYFFREDLLTKQQVVFAPLKIEVANISDNSSTIIWQTQEQAFGDVLLKENSSSIEVLPDDRDGKDPKKRFTHFVTLKNLKPNTKYSFKVRNNNLHYPKDFQEFKTTSAFDKDFREEKPVIGTVIGKDSKPVDEAVVLFKIDGATKLAVFTNPTGNFIIPIKNLYTEDLSDLYLLNSQTDATLFIDRGSEQSKIDVTLPVDDQVLSLLSLGKNINLRSYQRFSLIRQEEPTVPANLSFDLNKDGRVNSLDLSIVVQNLGKSPKVLEADINKDGIVDQKDIDLIKQNL